MAVVTLFMSDRDPNKTFDNKKDADNYDKMLELAENVSVWMEQEIPDLSESQVETIGLLIARNKDKLGLAMKGKSEVLLEKTESKEKPEGKSAKASGETVTPIAANG